ncbi:bifunctional hydroxymethylpyrimidine kinase/phosphomethylpyrimidine kinase [Pseudodonghicola flavimaris]|uniref:hydroxymethylpyrimidine kinase n=1 Tax=Pseudodonghicola flavimaris TaxID=3050036 RepID=A0ABT7F4Z2_9RHOB|nr:bifunctional hydroxymethylpyrimidine kinase/phosphomethylpyrimidine kinase [Pseudodonghicola flavimaris]MDK3019667.1 bifunctional hydroxymethylpyrimidine kinase/phosphomethylpyrimidine kinase [Pseudodonghicola flavimaris]
MTSPIPNILSIAGTDPSGGAGIHADLKTFSALGAYGMSAITAVVAQNTCGVRGVVTLEPDFVAAQIDAVFDDVRVDAVKIGMVANAGIIRAVADRLRTHRAANVVFDPVMVAKSGDRLLDPEAVAALKTELLPLATVITPNLPEAAVLLERAGEGDGADDWTAATMQGALPALRAMGPDWVLLKGGHLAGSVESTDLLAGPHGMQSFSAPRIATTNDHGTGCTLSAAIAALLPRMPMAQAVGRAKSYLQGALAASDRLDVGHGHGPLHHFHEVWTS